MKTQVPCVKCQVPTSMWEGRCTNGCCPDCHAKHCVPVRTALVDDAGAILAQIRRQRAVVDTKH